MMVLASKNTISTYDIENSIKTDAHVLLSDILYTCTNIDSSGVMRIYCLLIDCRLGEINTFNSKISYDEISSQNIVMVGERHIDYRVVLVVQEKGKAKEKSGARKVIVYNLLEKSQESEYSLEGGNKVLDVCLMKDGYVCFRLKKGVEIRDPRGAVYRRIEVGGITSSISYNCLREWISVGCEDGKIVDIRDINSTAPLLHVQHWHSSKVACVRWTQNGGVLMSGGKERVVVLWRDGNTKKEFVPRLSNEIKHISSDEFDEFIAVGFENNSMSVIRFSDKAIVFNLADVPSQEASQFKYCGYKHEEVIVYSGNLNSSYCMKDIETITSLNVLNRQTYDTITIECIAYQHPYIFIVSSHHLSHPNQTDKNDKYTPLQYFSVVSSGDIVNTVNRYTCEDIVSIHPITLNDRHFALLVSMNGLMQFYTRHTSNSTTVVLYNRIDVCPSHYTRYSHTRCDRCLFVQQ